MAEKGRVLHVCGDCVGGYRYPIRPVQRTDKDGKKYTSMEQVKEPCGTCDVSGWILGPPV